MQYLALLRGINVGGKGIVKMVELKESFEKAGYTNVRTYINSGNVLFESVETDTEKLEKDVENLLQQNFFAIMTVVVSKKKVHKILESMPHSWKNDDLRKYVAFVKPPTKPDEIIKEAQLKEGIDAIEKGPGVT